MRKRFIFVGVNAGGANGVIFGQADRFTAAPTTGGFTGTFPAGPTGALLEACGGQGLGIDTRALLGVTYGDSAGDANKLKITDGTQAVSGQGASHAFAFERAGVFEVSTV